MLTPSSSTYSLPPSLAALSLSLISSRLISSLSVLVPVCLSVLSVSSFWMFLSFSFFLYYHFDFLFSSLFNSGQSDKLSDLSQCLLVSKLCLVESRQTLFSFSFLRSLFCKFDHKSSGGTSPSSNRINRFAFPLTQSVLPLDLVVNIESNFSRPWQWNKKFVVLQSVH